MLNRELHLVGKNTFELRTNEKDFELASNEVLIKIKACSICGSDLSYARVSEHSPENSIILGHEFSGIIEQKGASVKHLEIGDKIVGEAGVFCGKCRFCLEGNNNFCENISFYGYPPYNGAFQDYLVYPADFCFKVPEKMDFAVSTLVEPLAVCLHSLHLSSFKLGNSSAVIGCGPIGLIMITLLKKAGASTIVACDPVKERREAALEYGADYVAHPDDFTGLVMSKTGNYGVDRVFEAAGPPDALRLTTEAAKSGAHIIMIGIPKTDDFSISHHEARKKGLTIVMVRRLRNTINQAIKMLTGGLGIETLITNRFSFDEAGKIFKQNQEYKDGMIKSVLTLD